jgi:ligand-binding sensor domain-containing protein
MKKITRALFMTLYLGSGFWSLSCARQAPAQAGKSDVQFVWMAGDTVSALSDSVWYIFQDSKNNYWFASNGQGVYRYDGKHILNFTKKHGLASNTLRQIQEDSLGNMYFSTMGGICKFDGKTFTTLQPVRTKEWKSGPNDLWFSVLGKSNEQGPYRYDGTTLYSLEFPKHFLHDEFMAARINSSYSPYDIYSIYKDRKGNMWFGTAEFGACRFDGQSVKWMYEKDLTLVPRGGSFGIRSMFEDREGLFWICNTFHRYQFDFEKTAQSDRLQYEKRSGIGNAGTFGGDDYIYYSHIVEDNQGTLWLTTWDQGVFTYDGRNITRYEVKDGAESVQLISMYKDNQGTMWLGTPDHGVFRWKGNGFERLIP